LGPLLHLLSRDPEDLCVEDCVWQHIADEVHDLQLTAGLIVELREHWSPLGLVNAVIAWLLAPVDRDAGWTIDQPTVLTAQVVVLLLLHFQFINDEKLVKFS
jgi:hypothetical protein